MASDSIYDLCLPTLQDGALDEDDKAEKIEQLIREQTDLKGKALEDATLDVLWRYRNSSLPSGTSPGVRHAVLRRNSPAPWQSSRGSTSLASSPRSAAASPVPPPGLPVRPALLRMRSSQQSPFTSPRASPRLTQASPLPSSSNLSHQLFKEVPPGPDTFGEYGSDDTDWSGNGQALDAAHPGYGYDFNSTGSDWLQSTIADMSPYDMLRSVLRDHKTDEELDAILEANGYDLSAAIISLMEDGNQQGTATAAMMEPEKTFLIGKSMAPASRPSTPGQTKTPIVCRYWLSTGQCLRADCKYSHDLSHHICKYWLAGNCLAGDSCIFSHDPSALMSNLSMNDSAYGSTPSLDIYQQNPQISDYNSFPLLPSTSATQANNDSARPTLVGTSSPRPLAPEFVPSRPHSRPSSRHQSPARHHDAGFSRLSADESDPFPVLGAATLRGHKKHHGKRGHGHGNRGGDKENTSASNSSLADVIRNSPTVTPIQSPRKNVRPRSSHQESREFSEAAAKIPAPEHIPWMETGNKVNHDYIKARQEAIRHGGARNKFLQSAAQAWNRNDVRAAKALSLRGQSENDLMREAHREAARALYDLRNRSHGGGRSGGSDEEVYVDLHGLHPAEAVSYLEAALKNQRTASALHREDDKANLLYAIVGTGHHSRGGRDKVGKAVRNYLNDGRFVYRDFSVAGSSGSGGGVGGGILGIDATSGNPAAAKGTRSSGDDDDNGEGLAESGRADNIETSPPLQHGKIRILKAEEAR